MNFLKLIVAVSTLMAAFAARAGQGPVIAGGVGSAPRALIIYSYATKSGYDDAGWNLVMRQIQEDRRQGLVKIVVPREESDRISMCVEYNTFAAFNEGERRFNTLLTGRNTISLSSNGGCR